jgi:soluble lytic murein transglycosylase-like protein
MFAQESAMGPRNLIDRWKAPINDASKRVGIPADWIRAIIMEESGGRTMMAENTPITSSMGAMGLMQVMPDTWREMQHIYNLGNDPYEPHDNIMAGAALLRTLYWEYGYPGMFAAYNDGPGMIEAHRRLKQLLPPETAAYVLDIASILRTGTRDAAREAASYAAMHRSNSTEPADVGNSIQPGLPQAYPEDDDDDYYNEN